ncbi:Golgi apyrase [Coemansia sp. RSA 2049]|nr:Golgi apyrase [Coemansia sp. RSA 2049]
MRIRLARRWRLPAALAFVVVLALCVAGAYHHRSRVLGFMEKESPERIGAANNNNNNNTSSNDNGGAADDGGRRYGVVIDAGSSGSRVMVYAWDHPTAAAAAAMAGNSSSSSSSGMLPAVARAVEEEHRWALKTHPGISSFTAHPHLVGPDHIRPLLDFAKQAIPEPQIASTPVYLLATAGMRMLPSSRQARIMDAACSFACANYAFRIDDCGQSFQVVSGETEGLYGWVAVNYLMGGFDVAGQGGRDGGQRRRQSHGFLDMGGASAQIAFEPSPAATKQILDDDLATVTLRSLDGNDHAFRVFVATFLGHGTNEARRRYVEQLQEQEQKQEQMLASGAARSGDSGSAADGLRAVDDPCLPSGLALPTLRGRPVVLLRGTGDFAACLAATEPLLNKTACPVEPCLFAGVHGPAIDFGAQKFVGVSEYWYAAHDYLGLGGVWDVDKFEARAGAFCRLPWADVLEKQTRLAAGQKVEVEEDAAVVVGRLQMQCFKAAWLVNVLHSGFGVPREAGAGGSSPFSFESVNHVGDIEVSWTLGALLLRIAQTIRPSARSAKARSVPGIRLPHSAAAAAAPGIDDGADLVDDALWSPLSFVGARRLLVLWTLLPAATRAGYALVLLAGCGILVALLLFFTLYRSRWSRLWSRGKRRHGGRRRSEEAIRMLSVARPLDSRLASPSGADAAEPLRRSPSMFVLAMPSSPASAAAAESSPPASRSSSTNNLALLSRRRGAAD